MLTYRIIDTKGKETVLKYPLSVSLVFSDDAPADSLTAVFAVNGEISEISSVIVENGYERVFNGFVDTQTEEESADGILLTIGARSLESIMLDNEALPQTYCMPSMPLLMERHFVPLGFTEYIGENKSFNGEMTVSKGMSEWSVLSTFCKRFLGTKPKIDCYGIIDITGSKSKDILYVSDQGKNRCIRKKRILKRNKIISEIIARTYISGGYEMTLKSDKADVLGIKRKRYVNSIDSASRSVKSVKNMITNSNNGYEEIIADFSGCVLCSIGSCIVFDNDSRKMTVRQIRYSLDHNGETTRISMEVQS